MNEASLCIKVESKYSKISEVSLTFYIKLEFLDYIREIIFETTFEKFNEKIRVLPFTIYITKELHLVKSLLKKSPQLYILMLRRK